MGMVWHQKFPNPPIEEALLDIRANLPAHIDLALLETFQNSLKESFPNRKPLFHWEGGMEIKEGVASVLAPKGGTMGYQFMSGNGKKVIQARKNGFSFHILKPYDSWESLRDQAKQLWAHYLEIAHPINVNRVALRYINRIEIPLPFKEFKEYLLIIPELPPEIPIGVSEFFMRLVMPDTEKNLAAIVTEVLQKIDEKKGILPIILDIDTFQESVLAAEGAELWAKLEELRNFKNMIFFKSITEKTEELFK